LKRHPPGRAAARARSPPTRGRGLKHEPEQSANTDLRVAPHAGAWIETPIVRASYVDPKSRPPRGGVD